MDKMNASFRLTVLAGWMLLGMPAAMGQPADGPYAGAQPDAPESSEPITGAGGGHHGHGRHQGPAGAADQAAPGLPKAVEVPRQRLDAGALLCIAEDQLRAHQAAIKARIAGLQAREPAGCHVVPDLVAVTVLSRDGQSATQVRVPGDPPRTGWTDSLVREGLEAYGQ